MAELVEPVGEFIRQIMPESPGVAARCPEQMKTRDGAAVPLVDGGDASPRIVAVQDVETDVGMQIDAQMLRESGRFRGNAPPAAFASPWKKTATAFRAIVLWFPG